MTPNPASQPTTERATRRPAGHGSLRDVIEHPDFTEDIVLLRGETVGQDGTGFSRFEDPVRIQAVITAPDAREYGVSATGPQEGVEHLLLAMLDANITEDDRVLYDDGFGQQAYRVLETEPTKFAGDEFAWHTLSEDDRGDEYDPGDDSGETDDDSSGAGGGEDYLTR